MLRTFSPIIPFSPNPLRRCGNYSGYICIYIYIYIFTHTHPPTHPPTHVYILSFAYRFTSSLVTCKFSASLKTNEPLAPSPLLCDPIFPPPTLHHPQTPLIRSRTSCVALPALYCFEQILLLLLLLSLLSLALSCRRLTVECGRCTRDSHTCRPPAHYNTRTRCSRH